VSKPDESETAVDEETLKRVRERVLEAEKDKLDLDLARGINNDIEQIIREEVDR
jgi:hypothetical protein